MLSPGSTTLVVSAPIALTPGRDFPIRHTTARQRYSHLPDLVPLTAELGYLTGLGGVAVTVDERRGPRDSWVRLYAQRCCIGVRPAPRANAYIVEFIEPMNLRCHERLARGHLWLAPTNWVYSPTLAGVLPDCQAPDQQIRQAWRQLHAAGPVSAASRPRRYDDFCDALEIAAEGARQIKAAQRQVRGVLSYHEVRGAGEPGQPVAETYVFSLSRPVAVNRGDPVQSRQTAELRGTVTGVDGERLTVRLDTALPRPRIPERGELVIGDDQAATRGQRDAIAALRAGSTHHRRLLALLVDGAFATPYPKHGGEPATAFDGAQATRSSTATASPGSVPVVGPSAGSAVGSAPVVGPSAGSAVGSAPVVGPSEGSAVGSAPVVGPSAGSAAVAGASGTGAAVSEGSGDNTEADAATPPQGRVPAGTRGPEQPPAPARSSDRPAAGAPRMGRLALVPRPAQAQSNETQGEDSAATAREAGSDPELAEVVRRALAVPDMLLVWGAPGTERARAIVEITVAAAARGERVLIASRSDAALDSVMARLPSDLVVVRTGDDERISIPVRHSTLSRVAVEFQSRTLARSASSGERLAGWLGDPSPAREWLRRLDGALNEIPGAYAARATAVAERQVAVAVVEAKFAERLESARRALRDAEREAVRAAVRVGRLDERSRRARRRANGVLRFYYRWLLGYRRRRLARANQRSRAALAGMRAARNAYAGRIVELRHAIEVDPDVWRADARVAEADAAVAAVLAVARQAADRYTDLLAGLMPAPRVKNGIDGLRELANWCAEREPLLRRRAELMHQWRRQLTEPAEGLHPELTRYADVIGTTCASAAGGGDLPADVDFDLVVLDEAGQLPLPDALAPLTRARRAVLVGDHQQLPPFAEDEVREWLGRRTAEPDSDPEQLADLLTHSAFEHLILRAPEPNRMLLAGQRRMPAALADFVSARFYGGRLRTDLEPLLSSSLFASALAVVDTSDLPEDERSEREQGRTETWHMVGFDNPTEARIAQDLVQWYADHGRDWVIIAPYQAQVRLLEEHLTEELTGEEVTGRIGTVDAFRGEEHDIVIYSCTRSNASGLLGAARDPRALNAAFTTAREQLVVIGDLATLTAANDPELRDFAVELRDYARREGDLVSVRQLRERLP